MKTKKEIRELLEDRKNAPSVFDEQALMIENFDDLTSTCLALYTKLEEMEKELAKWKPEPMKCETCGATTEDVSYRANAYAQDVGNDPTAMHTVCDKCDYENRMAI